MSVDETHKEALERGQKEGHSAATQEEHGRRLDKINHSIDRTGEALAALEEAIHQLDANSQRSLQVTEMKMQQRWDELRSDIRKLNEDQRIRDTALTVAAEGIAKQTEERREALATSGSLFSRRQQIVGIGLSVFGLLVGIYFATN